MRTAFLPTCDPRADLRALADEVATALSSSSMDEAGRAFDHRAHGDAWRMVPLLRGGLLPPGAIRLAGGAAGLATMLGHSVRSSWDAAHALARGEPPVVPAAAMAVFTEPAPPSYKKDLLKLSQEELEMLRTRVAEEDARIAGETPEMRSYSEPWIEEKRRRIAELTGRPLLAANKTVIAHALFAAPVGAGDESFDELAEDRQLLFLNRHQGPAWEGLALAIDACAAASHSAVEELERFARKHSAHAWALWLDEAAASMAGHRRASRATEALDAALTGAEDGAVARSMIEFTRGYLFHPKLQKVQDAWILQSAAKRRVDEEDEPLADEATLAKAMAGDPIALKLVSIADTLDHMFMRGIREEEASLGPFADIEPQQHVWSSLLGGVWAMLFGFRCLFGIELARGALPEIYAWLDEARA